MIKVTLGGGGVLATSREEALKMLFAFFFLCPQCRNIDPYCGNISLWILPNHPTLMYLSTADTNF